MRVKRVNREQEGGDTHRRLRVVVVGAADVDPLAGRLAIDDERGQRICSKDVEWQALRPNVKDAHSALEPTQRRRRWRGG